MNSDKVLGKVGKFKVCFRDEHLTSHAGVVLVHELAERLGVEQIVDEELQVKQRERGDTEGQAIGGLVHNLLLGGECLSALEGLRGDPGTQERLAQEALLAPRTAREFLQKFALGDRRDLQRVNLRLPQRGRSQQSWATGTIALESRIYEQASTRKQGSDKADKGEIGYPPLLAVWGPKRGSYSSVSCAAAVRIPVVTCSGFCASPSSGCPPLGPLPCGRTGAFRARR